MGNPNNNTPNITFRNRTQISYRSPHRVLEEVVIVGEAEQKGVDQVIEDPLSFSTRILLKRGQQQLRRKTLREAAFHMRFLHFPFLFSKITLACFSFYVKINWTFLSCMLSTETKTSQLFVFTLRVFVHDRNPNFFLVNKVEVLLCPCQRVYHISRTTKNHKSHSTLLPGQRRSLVK